MPNQRWLFVFTALALLILLVPACGGEEEETISTPMNTTVVTATPTATPTEMPIVTPTATPITTSSGPVKIGAVTAWSGPAAMSGLAIADPIIKLVEKQVQDLGGILGGRQVQIVRYDNRASVAEAQAGVKKLVLEDRVSAITLGGVSGAEMEAIAAAAEEIQVLYVSFGGLVKLAEMKFSVSATATRETNRDVMVNFLNTSLKPKTAGFWGKTILTAASW